MSAVQVGIICGVVSVEAGDRGWGAVWIVYAVFAFISTLHGRPAADPERSNR